MCRSFLLICFKIAYNVLEFDHLMIPLASSLVMIQILIFSKVDIYQRFGSNYFKSRLNFDSVI